MSASRETYLVHCSSCQAPFDAFKNYKVDDYLAKSLNFNQQRAVLQKHVGQEQ